jgi:hypothetical protein
MGAVAFLAAAALVVIVGVAILLVHHRVPRGEHLGIEEFRKEMRALATDRRDEPDPAGVRIIGRPTDEE